MADFITAKGAAYHLEQIISGARERLVLISPYLKLSNVFLERLEDAERRGVPTTIVYGKEELQKGERERLSRLSALQLLFLENLHAKCYFNEADMIITSMNMYEASEKNREMGVRLRVGDPAFVAALGEAESIIAAATRTIAKASPERAKAPVFQRSASRQPAVGAPEAGRGYCIRCHRGIFLNRDRPLCIDCYDVWSNFGNYDYPEVFCHDCGRRDETSMRRPLCMSCFVGAARF